MDYDRGPGLACSAHFMTSPFIHKRSLSTDVRVFNRQLMQAFAAMLPFDGLEQKKSKITAHSRCNTYSNDYLNFVSCT
jgi:hypothetical protein